jgi:hypothetical protein
LTSNKHWATAIEMMIGEANPLATQIILGDTILQEALERISVKWDFTVRELASKPKGMRTAWLKHVARAHRVSQTNGTHFRPTGTPVWTGSTLTPEHIALLIQFRCMKARGHIRTIKHCVLCHQTNIEQHTIQHYLTQCAHGAQVARDEARQEALGEQDREDWNNMNESTMAEMCASPNKRENLLTLALDTLQHCQLFVQQHVTATH